MALDFQHIPVELTGLDTKTDPNKLQPGSLLTLQNCVMQRTGRLTPRYGWDAATSAQFTEAWQAMSGDQSVFIGANGGVTQLLPSGAATAATNAFTPKMAQLFDPMGTVPGALVSGEWVPARSQFALAQGVGCGFVNAAAGAVMDVYAWNATSKSVGGIFKVTVASGLASATCDKEFSGNLGRVVYRDNATGNWYYVKIIPSSSINPFVISGITYLGTNANDRMDSVFIRGTNGIGYHGIAWYDHATTTVKLSVIDEFNGQTVYTVNAAITAVSLNVTRTYDHKIMVTIATAANTFVYIYDQTGLVTSSGAIAIAGVTYTATANGGQYIFIREGASTVDFTYVNRSGLAVSTVTVPSAKGHSTIDCDDSGNTYVVLRTAPDTTKPALTSYMLYVNTSLNGTILGDLAAPQAYLTPPEMNVSDSTISVPLNKITQVNTALGEAAFDAIACSFDRGSTAAQITKSTWIPWNGSYITSIYGQPAVLDLRPGASGANVTNAQSPILLSFPSAPIQPTITTNAGAGIAAGTYTFVSIYEAQDFNGNVIYSSLSQTVTNAPGVDVASFNVVVKDPPWPGARVTVYRTTNGGTVLYKIIDKTAAGTYVSATTDADLVGSTPLYTTGGILESGPVPPARGIFYAKNRAWIISAEADNVVYFSTELRPKELPRFNESLLLHVNPTGGQLTAVAEMDDKIIIFRENSIYLSYGQGPDETGAGGFQEPILIHSARGCIAPRSVVLVDDGLMFKSNEGIQLLTKSLQVAPIGAQVESFNALTISGAHYLYDRDQVHFHTVEGTTLVYDMYHKLWTTFTQPTTYATTLANSGFIYLSSITSKKILRDLASIATDDGASFTIRVKPGMLSFAGIQGFQRVINMTFLGRNVNTASIQTFVDYDTTTVVDTFSVPDTVGNQWQNKPSRQQCEAMTFDYAVVASTTWYLSSVTFEVGAKAGTYKFDRSKRV